MKPPNERPGVGVDASGDPVVDPTLNVLGLVEAAVTRLNDLREAETRRHDDLRAMEARHAAETQKLLLDFQEKLRDAESKRIDAIRAVDVNAVAVASGRATDQAAVLASQVSQSAEGLRVLVADTARNMATQQAAQFAEFNKRLSELERSKYEVAGRAGVTDPQMAQLLSAVQSLRESRDTSRGKSAGASSLWGLIIGGVGLVTALIGILAFIESLKVGR